MPGPIHYHQPRQQPAGDAWILPPEPYRPPAASPRDTRPWIGKAKKRPRR